MDQLIYASLSYTHFWYEVGMLKVPAIYSVGVGWAASSSVQRVLIEYELSSHMAEYCMDQQGVFANSARGQLNSFVFPPHPVSRQPGPFYILRLTLFLTHKISPNFRAASM